MEEIVLVAGGAFLMGSDRHYPEEAPSHRAEVGAFFIDPAPVASRQFAGFVEASGYFTVAERPPNRADYPGTTPGMLAPGALVFQWTSDCSPSTTKPTRRRPVADHIGFRCIRRTH